MKIHPYTGVDDGMPRLREYQEVAIQRALSEPTHGVLIGDEPGRGKTVTATEIALRAGFKRMLFIGIKDTFDEWQRTITEQSDGTATLRRIDGTKAGKQALKDMLAGADGWFFSGSQMITAQDWAYQPAFNDDGTPKWKVVKATGQPVLKPGVGIGPAEFPIRVNDRIHLKTYKKMKPMEAIVFDEVHAIANRKAIGKRTLQSIPTDWRIGMSGTWSGNTPEGMWSVARWVFPDHVDASFIRWRRETCTTEDIYAAGGRAVTTVTGEREPGAFANGLPCYIQNRAPEQAPEPKLVYVDMTPEQQAQWTDLQNDLLTWVLAHDGDYQPLVADIPIVLRSRLRSVALAELSFDKDGDVGFAPNAKSSKLTALRGILDYYGAQPVLIYTDSRKFANLTVARLNAAGYTAAAWTGDVNSKERARVKEAFAAGEFQYLVATVQSIGTGVNGLQYVTNKLVWASEAEGNPTLNEQGVARLFRSGMTDAHGGFEQVKILARGSNDTETMERVLEKAAAIAASMRATTQIAA